MLSIMPAILSHYAKDKKMQWKCSWLCLLTLSGLHFLSFLTAIKGICDQMHFMITYSGQWFICWPWLFLGVPICQTWTAVGGVKITLVVPTEALIGWVLNSGYSHSQEHQHDYKMRRRFREIQFSQGRLKKTWQTWTTICRTCKSACVLLYTQSRLLLKPADASSEIFPELISSNHTDCSQQKINLIFCQSGCQLLKIWSLSFLHSHLSPPSLSTLFKPWLIKMEREGFAVGIQLIVEVNYRAQWII